MSVNAFNAADGRDMRSVELLSRGNKAKPNDPERDGDGAPLEDDTRRALFDIVRARGAGGYPGSNGGERRKPGRRPATGVDSGTRHVHDRRARHREDET